MTEPNRDGFRELSPRDVESPSRAEPDVQLRLLVARLRRGLDCDLVSAWVVADGETWVVGSAGPRPPWVDPAKGFPRKCTLDGPLHPRDEYVQNDLEPGAAGPPMEARFREHGFRAYAATPLRSGDTRLGTLYAFSRTPRYFTPAHVKRMREDAAVIAVMSHHSILLRTHRRQARMLDIAHGILRELHGVAGVRSTCDVLVQRIGDIQGAETAALYLFNDDTTWLTCEACFEPDDESNGSRLLPSLETASLVTSFEALDRPVTVELPHTDIPWPDSVLRFFRCDDAGSLAVLPLTAAQQPVGLVLCRFGKGSTPPVVGTEWSILGEHLARWLRDQGAARVQERSVRIFAGLLGLEHGSGATEMTELPRRIARRARDLCDADDATIFRLERDGRTLRPLVCLGTHSNQVLDIRVRMGEGITGVVAASRRGEIVNHAERDPRTVSLPDTTEPEAVLAVPLVAPGHLFGVLTLHKLDGRTFDPVDLDKLETFAGTAAAALETARVALEYDLERRLLSKRIEQIPEGLVFTDSEGRITMLNRAAAALLKIDGERSLGEHLNGHLTGGEFASLCVALETLDKGDLPRLSQELALDGRTYLCSVSALESEAPAERGRALVFQDVTDLKEVEAQLHQSSKMSAVGQLAAGVAHEFNNLIAGIYGYAQFMQEHSDPDVVKKGVDVILRSSERARELTESLLTFSHRRPGRKEPVDLNQILADTLLLSHPQLERSHVKVVRELEEIPLTVADGGKMQQVFLDLILNAHQAMPDGGTLTVSSRYRDGNIEIRIEDDGPGIKPEHLPRIFEPFFTTKGALGGATVPGTGLGLSGAYNVLRHHGGQLEVRSEYGHGASFLITLPVRSLHAGTESGKPLRDAKDVDCCGRILVVDDNPAVRALVTEILEELGHEVLQTETALQAVSRLESWQADMLIVDRLAPGMGDMRAYERIRQAYPRLPILFITSRDSKASLESEGDPWMFRLNKPFRNRDLVTLVSRVLGQSLDTAS